MLKKNIKATFLAMSAACSVALAQNQGPQKPDPSEMAEKETERLENVLGLEDWQLFYLDSILVNNYSELFKEMETLQRAHVENVGLYYSIQDKWMERTEEAYKKLFTEEQWNKYLKQGGERIMKDRAKRREKANVSIEKNKKKR